MSKEYLEALERIETTFSMNKQGKESVYREYTNSVYPYYEDFNLVLNALQRLEAIDNAIEICKKANEQNFVYIKESYGIVKEKFLDDLDYEVINNRLYVNSRGMYYDFPLKDYGNWWALTKEELEND